MQLRSADEGSTVFYKVRLSVRIKLAPPPPLGSFEQARQTVRVLKLMPRP